jgi:hypothetical protein
MDQIIPISHSKDHQLQGSRLVQEFSISRIDVTNARDAFAKFLANLHARGYEVEKLLDIIGSPVH